MIDTKTIETLEFDKILFKVTSFAASDCSKEEILNLLPSTKIETAQQLLNLTEEMYWLVHKLNRSPIIKIEDCKSIIKKSVAHAMLNMGELLKIAILIRSARIAKKEILAVSENVPNLTRLIDGLDPPTDLEKAIGDSIANDSEMKDSASDALRSIRQKILAADKKLKDKLNSYAKSSTYAKVLQDSVVTIRNGRFVLPVKAECRNEIQGLIHDKSSTGATVFIEPMAVVELNNELKNLQLEETHEIERILQMLSGWVMGYAEKLEKAQKICIECDIIHAKMSYGVSLRATKPILNDKGILNLKKARHPLIDTKTVVPVDLSLGKNFRLLLITGPNTGGKTVCLKTAGLFCAMAATGLFIPSEEESEVAIFDRIFCDIGDDQSIANSLSTFSSHILNISSITKAVTDKSLILLDELGSGTDPKEGAALGLGILQFFIERGVKGILTTHYSELKEYAFTSKAVENACMQFDEKSLKPTYKLLMGIPGASHALKISESLGLNPKILKTARDSIGSRDERFEEVLKEAESAKAKALEDAEKAEVLREEVEVALGQVKNERAILQEKLANMNERTKAEVKKVVGNVTDKASELIEQMQELIKEADEKALLKAKQLRSQIEDLVYTAAEEKAPKKTKPLEAKDIVVGMQVAAEGIEGDATVLSLPDKRGEVNLKVGNLQIKMKAGKLRAVVSSSASKVDTMLQAQAQRSKKINVSNITSATTTKKTIPAPTTQEIKMLGLTVSESIEVLEPYIMSSTGQAVTLKIVHGKGTGTLGKGIQQYLRANKSVISVRYGKYGEGETGVTFAELK
ncbi:MAG: endonuclease MutS2 [Firmicutes bacterium]|nr:endonuclease MutS2 [Bacillota bacterium]